MKENFIGKYNLQKTLRFSLIPVGKTEEFFEQRKLLEQDSARANAYEIVKKCIDRYHKNFIEETLSGFIIDELQSYAELYYKTSKTDKETAALEKLEGDMRKAISKRMTGDERYKYIFKKDMLTELQPINEDEEKAIDSFKKFYTYFTGFNTNRKNIYKDSIKNSIAWRCINENLPRFLDNASIFSKIHKALIDENPDGFENSMRLLEKNAQLLYGTEIKDMFCHEYFSFVLSQSGIDKYNYVLGGYSCSDGTKIQGINVLINLYNQKIEKKDKGLRLPLLKPLYKQILSDSEKISLIPEKFNSDNEVISAVGEYCQEIDSDSFKCFCSLTELFSEFPSFDRSGIYISSGKAVDDLSNKVFGNWSTVANKWQEEYMQQHPQKKKQTEKYLEEINREYRKIKSFSLAEIERLTGDKEDRVSAYYKKAAEEAKEKFYCCYDKAKAILNGGKYSDYKNEKRLCKNIEDKTFLKDLLDSVKDAERTFKPLLGTGKEEAKDQVFYGRFCEIMDELCRVDKLYDKVRNYVTQKPYSKDKIKLNFENPQLLGGWDMNKENDYRTILLEKKGNYYLAVMNKGQRVDFADAEEYEGENTYRKMEYKYLSDPSKEFPHVFFPPTNPEKYIKKTESDNKILKIYNSKTYTKGENFNLEDCHALIDFYKKAISLYESWKIFGFRFRDTKDYNDINEFYNDIKNQGYSVKFRNIRAKDVDALVEKGDIYLFRIYNKDFSDKKKKTGTGTDNLHTMYFKMLFDEQNLKNVVYKLNGRAEMFYRKASISENERIVHPANKPIENKNPNSNAKTSVFDYDIIKDRRFTKRQFSLHLPITLNFKSADYRSVNKEVLRSIKDSEENYIIGIDRGERNLLYISVINSRGEIVEQRSLNSIISSNGCKTDYHKLLDEKEDKRDKERKSWDSIENIKELKEGYLSYVVNEICKLVLKYDAIIAMEDLNFGFKRGRFKIEKQVYQKFENALISKLNYLVDKHTAPSADGGLLRAYQLTNRADEVNKGKQNGIIFFVPAYLTSKIDPVTGFADLLKPKYTSVDETAEFIERFDDIRYNEYENLFEFDFKYSNFPKTSDSEKKWTVCSCSDRIETFRNPEKNSEWDNKTVVLSEEWKTLFKAHNIDIKQDIKGQLLEQRSKELYGGFMCLMRLTLQMRNSETGSTDIDYLISPVRGADGKFFDSRRIDTEHPLPENADANGAYNIARKALWMTEQIKAADDEIDPKKLFIKNSEWLEYAQ